MEQENEVPAAESPMEASDETTGAAAAKDPAARETAPKDSDPAQEPEDFFAESLAALQKERDNYYDLLLRKQAEFDNYRKRVEREKMEARFAAKQEVLRELLNVLDACEQGLKSMEQCREQSLDSYREGYLLIQRQIRSLLAKFGVEEITALGQQFDPNVHEAVLHEVSDAHEEGEVMEEIKKGYRLQDRLLRPSQVKVARGGN